MGRKSINFICGIIAALIVGFGGMFIFNSPKELSIILSVMAFGIVKIEMDILDLKEEMSKRLSDLLNK